MQITDLTFFKPVTETEPGNAWHIDRDAVGRLDFGEANALGMRYADMLLDYVSAASNPTILSHVVRAIGGRVEALEIGFLTRIARSAAAYHGGTF